MLPCSGGAWALGYLILIVLVSTCTNKDTFQKVEIINTTERMVRKFPMESCCWLLQELNRFAELFNDRPAELFPSS